MSILLGVGIPILYLIGTLINARMNLMRWAKDPVSELNRSDLDAEDRMWLTFGAFLLGLFWPVSIPWFIAAKWLWLPVNKRNAKINQLRADRQRWIEVRSAAKTGSERYIMATDIIKSLNESIETLVDQR